MIELNIIGRIGSDAELKKLGENNYLAFSVCHSEKRGETEYSTWVDCLRYVKDENPKLKQYLTKGTQVYIKGTPRANAWIDKNTNEAKGGISVNVNQLELLGSKQGETASHNDSGGDVPF